MRFSFPADPDHDRHLYDGIQKQKSFRLHKNIAIATTRHALVLQNHFHASGDIRELVFHRARPERNTVERENP